MSNLKIVVVGVGLGGKIHIKRLRDNSEVVLSAVVAPNRLANHQFAQAEGVPIFHDLDETLRIVKPDGVIIASPNNFHVAQTKTCIDAGVAVLLEKPVSGNLEDARSLCEYISDKRTPVLVGHHRAHNPIIKNARDIIRGGRLGHVVTATGSAQFYKPDHYFNDGPWRRELGGGPVLINMIHEVDNFRRLIGEISQVQAITTNANRGFVVEDTAVINFIFKNGALGSFVVSDVAASSRSWEQTSGENPGYPSYASGDCYLIAGTKGSLSVPTMRLQYFDDETPPSWWTPFKEEVIMIEKKDPIELQLQHFIDVINGNAPPLVTVQDGFNNLLVIDAIKRSAQSRSIVDVSSA